MKITASSGSVEQVEITIFWSTVKIVERPPPRTLPKSWLQSSAFIIKIVYTVQCKTYIYIDDIFCVITVCPNLFILCHRNLNNQLDTLIVLQGLFYPLLPKIKLWSCILLLQYLLLQYLLLCRYNIKAHCESIYDFILHTFISQTSHQHDYLENPWKIYHEIPPLCDMVYYRCTL